MSRLYNQDYYEVPYIYQTFYDILEFTAGKSMVLSTILYRYYTHKYTIAIQFKCYIYNIYRTARRAQRKKNLFCLGWLFLFSCLEQIRSSRWSPSYMLLHLYFSNFHVGTERWIYLSWLFCENMVFVAYLACFITRKKGPILNFVF